MRLTILGGNNMYCSKCGKEIADNSQFCGNCGKEITGNNNKNNILNADNLQNIIEFVKKNKTVVIVIASIIVLVIAMSSISNHKKKQERKERIHQEILDGLDYRGTELR